MSTPRSIPSLKRSMNSVITNRLSEVYFFPVPQTAHKIYAVISKVSRIKVFRVWINFQFFTREASKKHSGEVINLIIVINTIRPETQNSVEIETGCFISSRGLRISMKSCGKTHWKAKNMQILLNIQITLSTWKSSQVSLFDNEKKKSSDILKVTFRVL